MIRYNVGVLGDMESGKTELANQFRLKHTATEYDPYTENGHELRVMVDDQPCVIEIYEIPSQEEYTALRNQWIRDCHGFVLVYSIVARQTFEGIQRYHNQIIHAKGTSDIPMILVGSECESLIEREVSRDEGTLKAKSLSCGFTEASTETSVSVDRIFYDVVRMIREAPEGAPPEAAKKNKLKNKLKCTIS
ncbi:Ras GTPase ras2 [Entomortierella chlamydospora]|uniref:Ras GTPase ras2 n=1 Tax=Entomortierella chlamydospora TaxID=101097 RepID=A0A9P6MSX3_9FUNG|nr:Ras GTPase ras2 [Entomortierella chlamydospora]